MNPKNWTSKTRNSLVSISLLALSCGCHDAIPQGTFVDSNLRLYYREFLFESGRRHWHMQPGTTLQSMTLVHELPDGIIGVCESWGSVLYRVGQVKVVDYLGCEEAERVVVFHELLHCLAGVAHSDESDFILMHPELPMLCTGWWDSNWPAVLNQVTKRIGRQ